MVPQSGISPGEETAELAIEKGEDESLPSPEDLVLPPCKRRAKPSLCKVMQGNSLVVSEEGRLCPRRHAAHPPFGRGRLLGGESLEEAAGTGSGGWVRAD